MGLLLLLSKHILQGMRVFSYVKAASSKHLQRRFLKKCCLGLRWTRPPDVASCSGAEHVTRRILCVSLLLEFHRHVLLFLFRENNKYLKILSEHLRGRVKKIYIQRIFSNIKYGLCKQLREL